MLYCFVFMKCFRSFFLLMDSLRESFSLALEFSPLSSPLIRIFQLHILRTLLILYVYSYSNRCIPFYFAFICITFFALILNHKKALLKKETHSIITLCFSVLCSHLAHFLKSNLKVQSFIHFLESMIRFLFFFGRVKSK